ncbi:acetyl-CoA carboxylase [Trichonephila clavipes]|nr:acetyl-CoA carboxylase [Trichonephila clavipes]
MEVLETAASARKMDDSPSSTYDEESSTFSVSVETSHEDFLNIINVAIMMQGMKDDTYYTKKFSAFCIQNRDLFMEKKLRRITFIVLHKATSFVTLAEQRSLLNCRSTIYTQKEQPKTHQNLLDTANKVALASNNLWTNVIFGLALFYVLMEPKIAGSVLSDKCATSIFTPSFTT